MDADSRILLQLHIRKSEAHHEQIGNRSIHGQGQQAQIRLHEILARIFQVHVDTFRDVWNQDERNHQRRLNSSRTTK